MKEIETVVLPTKQVHKGDNGDFGEGVLIGIAISLLALILVALIINITSLVIPDKYITQDAKVSAVYWDELHGKQIVTLQDKDDEEWQVYNKTLCLGDKVEMRRDTKETPELSDDEIIWVHKK